MLVVFTAGSIVNDRPANIDFLNVGQICNQNCRQCFMQENVGGETGGEEEFINKVVERNQGANFFIYPQEITLNTNLIEQISAVGQRDVLSNGGLITPDLIDLLRQSNVSRIKVTLFPDEEEQYFWNGNDSQEYRRIKTNLVLCKSAGLNTEIFTILTPQNKGKLPQLYCLAKELGISKINLLRLLPLGNGRQIEEKYFIKEKDLEEIIILTENLKQQIGPYLSFNLSFGLNCYGNRFRNYLGGKMTDAWVKTETLCPVVDNNYAGISTKTGNIYWCYRLVSDPDAIIGKVSEEGKLEIGGRPDFSKETLKERLTGICSKDNCEFQGYCLGGCRSFAYVFAKLRGEKEPEYNGADICRTKTMAKMGLVKESYIKLKKLRG